MSYIVFIRENLRWLLGGFLLTFFSSFGQTFFISLSGGEIRADYGLSNGEFGFLYMAATLASALSLPFVGRLVDLATVSRTVLLIAPMLALACLAMWSSTSVLVLGIALYFLRLFGQGMMTHTAMTAMGRWYAGHRGRAISLVTLGHQAGEAVLPITLVTLFAIYGWRDTWALASIALMVLALPAIFLLMRVERKPRSTDKPETHGARRNWTRGEVVRDPLFWLSCSAILAPAFIGTTIYFHQDYLVELRGWTPGIFASSFIVMSAMTITFGLISGFLIDRFSATRMLPVFLLPLGAACFALASIPAEYGIFVFMMFLGISYGISSTLFGAIWPEIYGVEHLGAIRSVTVALMVFGTALGPGVTGMMIDGGISYPAQIFTMGLYCLAVSGLMLFVSRRYLKRQNAPVSTPIDPEFS